MITRIREVRRSRGMTLDDVAKACDPPTTPQTIGRLETGTRTVSVGWLNRIAAALDVEAADLVESAQDAQLRVAAYLSADGASAPGRSALIVAPRIKAGQVAVMVTSGVGEYRSGDEIWCDTLQADEFGQALNRDVLVPRPAGRFLFARLIGREAPEQGEASGKLHLLPLGAGSRQQVVANPPWIAMAVKLVRSL